MKLVVEFKKKEERVLTIVAELEEKLEEKTAKVCGFREQLCPHNYFFLLLARFESLKRFTAKRCHCWS